MEPEGIPVDEVKAMSDQEKQELDERAKKGETVVKGGSGGHSLQAQLNLQEGRSKGGQTRAQELGHEGYHEMGRKGGLTTTEKSGGERMEEEGIDVDESKYSKK